MKIKLFKIFQISSLFLKSKFFLRQKYSSSRKPEFAFKPLKAVKARVKEDTGLRFYHQLARWLHRAPFSRHYGANIFPSLNPAFSVLLILVMLAANIFVFARAASGVLKKDTTPNPQIKGLALNTNVKSEQDVKTNGASATQDLSLLGKVFFDDSVAVKGNLTVGAKTLYADAAAETVGVGTKSPQRELDVAGNVKVGQELIVMRDARAYSDLTVDGATDLTGILNANGGIEIDGDKFIIDGKRGDVETEGTMRVHDQTWLNSNVSLGNDSSDTLETNARVGSNFIPKTTDTYDLGSASLYWNNLYAKSLNISGGQSIGGGMSITGTLGVTGATTLSNLSTGIAQADSQGLLSSNLGTLNYIPKWSATGLSTTSSIFDNGNVGIGTTGPDRKLDVLDAANPQLRLTYTDGTKYVDQQTLSTGDWYVNGNLGKLLKTDSANYNAFFGQQAFNNSEQSYNTGIGYQAGYNNNWVSGSQGRYNTYIGHKAGYGSASGDKNRSNLSTAIGASSQFSNTTGNNNTSIGVNSLYGNTTGQYNIALGNSSLFGANTGHYNISIGYLTMTSTNSGARNIGIGTQTLKNNTTGADNIAIGETNLLTNTIGHDNTAVGTYSQVNNTEGIYNTSTGMHSLFKNVTGNWNTGDGAGALLSNMTGNNNVGIGPHANGLNRTGSSNVGAGYQALYYNTNGDGNIGIGESAEYGFYNNTHTVAVGTTGVLTGSYYYRISYVLDGDETALSLYNSTPVAPVSQKVEITNIPIYSGSLTCTARKIYRTKAGDTGEGYNSIYYLLDTIFDNITTTYSDNISDGSLGSEYDGSNYSIMLGYKAKALTSSQFVIGSQDGPITQTYIGEGIISASPQDTVINATGGNGTNVSGSNLIFAGGRGSGSGIGGSISFKTAPAGASGTTLGTLAERVSIDSNGNVGIGTTTPQSQLQVNGYIQMNTNNGAPAAGDCDADSERGRMILDYTNNLLYICNGAARGWDNIALTN